MPTGGDGPLSRSEAKEALLRSGYLLESRVETVLRELGIYVEANASYEDPSTAKSRELDLFALVPERAGPDDADFVFAVLLIECVNNPHPLALITKDPLVPLLHHYEVKLSGLPVKFPEPTDSESWQGLTDFLSFDKFHHYCKGRIATQYCSFQKKKMGEWMAIHDEEHFDSFKKLCDAVDYFENQHYADWVFGDEERVNIQMYYPILVLQGQLLDARASKRSVSLRRVPHLQLRRAVATAGKQDEYQIDVIEERFLDRYLEVVAAELTKTARLLRRRHRVVRQAVDRIVAAAKTATTPQARRNAMEF